MDSYKPRIRAFLQEQMKGRTFADDDNYFKQGFVNSLFAMQLVLFVEKEFGITVDDDDLSIDNFNSVNAIDRLVSRKKGVSTT
jgi:acyl carrier protein